MKEFIIINLEWTRK